MTPAGDQAGAAVAAGGRQRLTEVERAAVRDLLTSAPYADVSIG